MAVDDYRRQFVPAMNIQFATASATPKITMATTPGTLSGWLHVNQPSYLSGQFNARGYVFTALHEMQTRYSDENSVCLSVCLSVRPSHA